MAVRNGERYLAEGVASIRAQTSSDWELIVVDDGSDDGTPEVLDGCCRADPRVQAVTLPTRHGPSAALDRGLAVARAEYVALLDHDDLAYPDRLVRQAAALDAHPSYGAVGCAVVAVDQDGRRPFERRYPAGSPPTTPVTVRWILPFLSPVLRSGLMARRAVIREIGGFSTVRPFADDYELCARLAAAAPFANVPDVLVRYRRHPGQISWTSGRAQKAAVLLIRQWLMWQRLGTIEPLEVLATIAATAGRQPPADEDEAARAVDLCERLFAAFLAAEHPTGDDLAWIEADHRARLSLLRVGTPAGPARPAGR